MRKKLARLEKFIALYLVGGLFLTLMLGVIFAIHVHFALSIVFGVAYFVGLRFVIVKIKQL